MSNIFVLNGAPPYPIAPRNLNAPAAAFGDTVAPFFGGTTIDDLPVPAHLDAKFVAMTALPACTGHDLMKNARAEPGFACFDAQIAARL
ncbi:MAG: hypothetical protein AAF848_12200 [Pseudomonadota bacterium]